ncbi:hypothetical protein AWB69_07719 [Caballeronia udeis]|uniref:Uncharacterized protein n=1 Tax=Caballeronia udeis TaxID=1232866 RepID=A0A158JEQ7_9BURK|nr:hypothetical protein [Caballeronia udeis]SAL67354.1 hypothetical protein AWB69_07719 [Caballeronia udeis]
MPNNHSNTDVVGPEILACSGGHSTPQFAPPSVEKFGLENARKAFAKASKISHPVTTRAAVNRFMLETDEHVIVDSGRFPAGILFTLVGTQFLTTHGLPGAAARATIRSRIPRKTAV